MASKLVGLEEAIGRTISYYNAYKENIMH